MKTFRNNEFSLDGNVAKFYGEKQLKDYDLSPVDFISSEMVTENLEEYISFDFTYNVDLSKIIVTASILDNGELLIDNLSGYVFETENGDLDAILNLDDGETVLISDLSNCCIEECGWLSKVIKGAISTVIVAVVVVVLPVTIPAVALVATAAAVYGVISVTEKKIAESNYNHNCSLVEPNKYINGQDYYSDWKFGTSTLDYNGCGVIAAYNVMRGIKKSKKLVEVIFDFDYNSGTIVSGVFGADPSHYSTYFDKNGIKYTRYSSYSTLQDGINRMNSNQMVLVCAWIGNTIFDGAHYVAASYNPNSKYHLTVYNKSGKNTSGSLYKVFDRNVIGGDFIAAFIVG